VRLDTLLPAHAVPWVAPGGRRATDRPGPSRLSWATLLRRAFAIKVLICDRCAGPRRIVGR
jgi:hypothetical protein